MRTLDVLVIGGSAGALATAALLGRRGMRGLLVEQGELGAPSSARREDWAPSDRKNPVLARMHTELGLQDELRRRLFPLNPGLRLVQGRLRDELEPTGAAALARWSGLPEAQVVDLLSPLVEQAVTVSGLLDETGPLPPAGYFARRRFRAHLHGHSELTETRPELPTPLASLLEAFASFFSASAWPTEGLSVARAGRMAELLLDGPHLPDGGRPLRAVLAERAERAGFEIAHGLVESIEPDGRRFELRISGRREVVFVSAVVDASHGLLGLQALGHGAGHKRLGPLLDALRPAAHRARFRWSVDSEVLPEALGRSALLLPSSTDLAQGALGGRPYWLSTFALEPDASSGRPRTLVELELSVSPAELQSGLQELERGPRTALGEVAPFFERGHPIAHPARSQPLLSPALEPELQLGGIYPKPPIDRLIPSGPSVFPGCHPVEGGYLAAFDAAERVSSALGTKR